MDEKFSIRFNLITREVEIEGSEEFVKNYFEKLQELLSELPEKGAKKSNTVEKHVPEKSGRRTTEKESGRKRVTNISSVLQLIQASTAGISTAEIKAQTGLVERQIWSIVDRAEKEGKIKKLKRGLYAATG